MLFIHNIQKDPQILSLNQWIYKRIKQLEESRYDLSTNHLQFLSTFNTQVLEDCCKHREDDNIKKSKWVYASVLQVFVGTWGHLVESNQQSIVNALALL